MKRYKRETQAVHAGLWDDDAGSVVTPIYQTSTFKFKSAEHGARLFAGEGSGYIYTRLGNPTIDALETAVAVLEGGHKGLACGSGMAATHTTLTSLLKAGDHVICSDAVYGPTNTLLNTVFSKFGISATFVNTADLNAVQRAFRPKTKVVFIETPGNPTLVISDIAAIAQLTHSHGALLVVDNTFMSPVLQQPMTHDADIVVHSMTKFLNGHADVVGGMIVVKEEDHYNTFRKTLNQIGGVISPFNAYLVARGIKTLAIRMERHCQVAGEIARFLQGHSKVASVYYPGLTSHPQHELAARQMRGFGGMISFELVGGIDAGRKLMNAVQLCTLAVSLGGVETLIQHPASMTHASMGPEARRRAKITDGLVRLSVGIEAPQDLIADLDRALERA